MVIAPPADDMRLILDLAEQIQDAGYAQFVCQRSYRYYAERVKQLGFANLGVVADVGCGYGQWSAALAEVNEAVIASICTTDDCASGGRLPSHCN